MARALALQARGQGFDSLILHEPKGGRFIDMMEEEDTRRELQEIEAIEQLRKDTREREHKERDVVNGIR